MGELDLTVLLFAPCDVLLWKMIAGNGGGAGEWGYGGGCEHYQYSFILTIFSCHSQYA